MRTFSEEITPRVSNVSNVSERVTFRVLLLKRIKILHVSVVSVAEGGRVCYTHNLGEEPRSHDVISPLRLRPGTGQRGTLTA